MLVHGFRGLGFGWRIVVEEGGFLSFRPGSSSRLNIPGGFHPLGKGQLLGELCMKPATLLAQARSRPWRLGITVVVGVRGKKARMGDVAGAWWAAWVLGETQLQSPPKSAFRFYTPPSISKWLLYVLAPSVCNFNNVLTIKSVS
jgi:hypothetical protein